MDILVSPQNEQEEKVLIAFLESLHYSYEAEPSEMDTTEYLLSNEANRKHLLESLQQAKEGKGTKINVDELFS